MIKVKRVSQPQYSSQSFTSKQQSNIVPEKKRDYNDIVESLIVDQSINANVINKIASYLDNKPARAEIPSFQASSPLFGNHSLSPELTNSDSFSNEDSTDSGVFVQANSTTTTTKTTLTNFAEPEIKGRPKLLSEVMKTVMKWRQIRNKGKLTKDNKKVKVSFNEAAEMLGLSLKSLNDYLRVIKLGEKFNFDFEKNMNKKFGVLRKFVSDKKLKGEPITNTDDSASDCLCFENFISTQSTPVHQINRTNNKIQKNKIHF
eukprot:CAMPEP_0114576128 /NCGR_PEP_ID=MMETSP0125-20121206/914_1 /TAXON_ID=485358 ORGANISM="Aristerostoma sp., Strain ATCC 50986" /NCGR_SAMPLE_ID=MMETSP0125 /ASSEMBLY_ACC=CAM_ASM_000245 /LENGTH=259 /DNA_ID=CAMNT_0001764381 /DNA_START=372 /DNA_END=1151 /DNA_ORIENTATION=+